MKSSIKFALIILLSLLPAFIAESDAEDDEDPFLYNEVDFQQTVDSEPHFIMFFAPWCGHCKSLKPAWNELSEFYNKEETDIITIAKVDCTQNSKLCSDNGVTGYPTLKIYQPGKDSVRYKGARDLDSLKEFISTTLGDEQQQKDDEPVAQIDVNEGLYEVTDDTFSSHIAEGAHFIKFFAPWCGHCKRMEPAWKELAAKYENSEAVKIGRVDCTKNQKVCGSNGVRGYPTLLWFKNGEEADKYQGGRSLENFEKYIARMTGVEEDTETEEEQKEVVQKAEEPKEMEVSEGLYDLTAENFKSLTSEGDFFVKFFAPWCGHCKRMEPAWKELAKFYEDHEQVKIGRVDCTQHQSVCSSVGVRGYPTLKYFKNGKETEASAGGRDIDSLKDFVKRMLETEQQQEEQQQEQEEEEEKQEAEPTGALELDSDTFQDVIDTGLTFVKFYAPWCGHCKRLAPTWDQLAGEDFSEAGRPVRIVKVDCTKHQGICTENGVRGYPTLKLFDRGEEKSKFSGGRNLEALKAFVIKNAAEAEDDLAQQKDEL